ncbi:MAG: hypothetical protein FRX49_13114, partial [Trebouxia sp. A1-2]
MVTRGATPPSEAMPAEMSSVPGHCFLALGSSRAQHGGQAGQAPMAQHQGAHLTMSLHQHGQGRRTSKLHPCPSHLHNMKRWGIATRGDLEGLGEWDNGRQGSDLVGRLGAQSQTQGTADFQLRAENAKLLLVAVHQSQARQSRGEVSNDDGEGLGGHQGKKHWMGDLGNNVVSGGVMGDEACQDDDGGVYPGSHGSASTLSGEVLQGSQGSSLALVAPTPEHQEEGLHQLHASHAINVWDGRGLTGGASLQDARGPGGG